MINYIITFIVCNPFAMYSTCIGISLLAILIGAKHIKNILKE